MSRLVLYLVLIVFLSSCSSDIEQTANSVMQDISDGVIYYATTTTTPILIAHNDQITDIVWNHILVQSDVVLNSDDAFILKTQTFDFPKSIESYELVDKSEVFKDELFAQSTFDRETFDKYFKDNYEGYEDYVAKSLKGYEGYDNFVFLPETNSVKYSKKYNRQHYIYKVKARGGTYRVNMSMFEFPEGWKVGSIFTDKI